jgi:hypothetical protein
MEQAAWSLHSLKTDFKGKTVSVEDVAKTTRIVINLYLIVATKAADKVGGIWAILDFHTIPEKHISVKKSACTTGSVYKRHLGIKSVLFPVNIRMISPDQE